MDTKKTDVTAKTTSTNTAAKKAKPSSTKKTGSNTHGTANVGTTVEQEVVGGVDPKIRRKIKLVKEHAEGWEDEDIIRVLEETNFDENLAINNILDGIVSKTGDNWTTFETKKKKQKEAQSHVTEQPRGSRGGRGRGRGRGQSDDNLPPRFQGAGRGSSSHRPGDVGPGARGGKVVPPRQQQQQGEFNNRTNAKRPPEHEGAGVGNGVVQHHVDVTRTYDTSVPGKSLADIVRSGGRSAPPPAVQSAALAQQPQQQQQQQQQQPQQQPQQQTQHISTTPDISGTQQQQPSSQSQPQPQHISTPSDISSQQATQQSQQAAQQAQLQAQQQAQLQLQAQAQLQAQQAAQQAQIQAQQAAQQAQLQAQQQQESQQAAAQSASSVEQSQPSQQSSSASYPSMSQRYSAPGSTTVWMPKETQSHQPEVPAVSQGQQQPQQQSQQQPQQSQQSQQPTQQPQQTQQQPSQAFNSNVVPIPPSSQSVGNADLSKGMTRGPVVLPGGYTDELHLQFGNLSFGRSDAELAAVSDDNAANGPQGTTDQQTKSQSSESQSQASIPMQVPQGMAHHHLAQPMGAMAGMGSLTGMPDADQPLPMPPYGYMPDPYAGMHYAYDMQGADLARLSQGGRLPMGYYEPYQPAMTAGYRTTQDSKFPQGARSTSPTSLNGTSPATSTVGSGSTRDSSQQSSKQSNQPLSPHQQHAPQHYGSAQYSSVSPPMYGYPPYMANQYASYQPPTQAHQYQLPYQRVQYYKQPGAAPGAYPAMHGGMSTVGYDELAPEYSKGYGLPQHGLHSSFFLPSDPKTSPTPSTPPTSKAQTGFSSSASSSSSTSESTSPATSKYSAQADYKYPSGRDVSQTSYYGASMTNQPAFSQGGQAAFPFMQQPPPHHMMQPQSYQARNYSQV